MPDLSDVEVRTLKSLPQHGSPYEIGGAILRDRDVTDPMSGANVYDRRILLVTLRSALAEIALAAAPVTDAGLDVERLATVLTTLDPDTGQDDWQLIHVSQGDDYAKSRREWAHAIAAEYAALSRQAEKETA
jgi:hypothetical protein